MFYSDREGYVLMCKGNQMPSSEKMEFWNSFYFLFFLHESKQL